MFESNLSGVCEASMLIGISMLINLFLGFTIYFMRTNHLSLQTSLKHAYEQSLYDKTRDMLGELYEAAKRIARNIEAEESRDEFNRFLGGICHAVSSNEKCLIETVQYIVSDYLQLFAKGNTLLCTECHEEVIKDYFRFISRLNENSDYEVMISVLRDRYNLLTQKENVCREVIENIE